ncbi:MAG: bifunctional nuclease family protein [Gemmatimonas sp.]|jgi:bifunctional DNase/RNase|uniref:bifunctional nuclease family protein n=1 Tax=Gemmatimonas sp. TaxID=1962908 RepID=UPI00391F8AA6|nr:bifunctional nuclease family protein [Gemmatimonadota bacterium]
MVEVVVARLGIDSASGGYVVILRERAGHRVLPIWIGQPEALSIAEQLNQIRRERPLTHDLCKALITGLGGTLRRVTITRVEKNTYFAELQIAGPGGVVEVDARPSDSIAIALRLSAPIYAQASLLAELDGDDDEAPDLPATPPEGELTSDQLKAYLERLRPEDFGKFSP